MEQILEKFEKGFPQTDLQVLEAIDLCLHVVLPRMRCTHEREDCKLTICPARIEQPAKSSSGKRSPHLNCKLTILLNSVLRTLHP